MRTSRHTLRGSELFREGQRIYVNRIEEKFDLGQHEHDFIEWNYVAEGNGYHYLEDRALPASRGDLFALPVGSSHVFRPYSLEKNRRLVVYNVVFAEELMGEIAESAPELGLGELWRSLSAGPLEAGIVRDPLLRLEPLFERMHEEHAAAKPGYGALLRSMLAQLVIEWARLLCAEAVPGNRTGSDLIGDAASFVRERAAEPLTIREVAETFRLSERHFRRLFKRHTGQTFHEFVQRQRILTACELLRTTRHKLDTVAGMVGYRDLQTFSRVFKRIEGSSPGRYRKSFFR
ncbi:AraC family transcriptional regulator [Cohnella sp. AR92]|uniref:helix-turn-helix domain-containing protein n=1 Tax=Cohnella sp. AR92 TaxID=648716 RepID=UPI0013158267|nr:AraC family transcriptional regulator [Cohnella sp. AR92]